MRSELTTMVVHGNKVGVPTKDAIAATLRPQGVVLSDAQIAQVQLYVATLVLWNDRINITSVTDPFEILVRHFAESFLGATDIPAAVGKRLVDVGSGPGFPGLALKIVRPSFEVHLVEQNAKKAAFLSEIARTLELPDVHVHRASYESLPPDIGRFDFVTCRALGDYKRLLKWSVERLKGANGTVILWLGVEEANKVSREAGWFWSKPTLIPGSRQRVILVGTPNAGLPVSNRK
jgi:16S rRNA (guanine(527)-N(7))-methyltransferase RsmG